jgi:hypothetical protein
MITILGWVVNLSRGGPIWTLNEHENLEFDDEQDTQMSAETYEESGNTLNLDLFTISH